MVRGLLPNSVVNWTQATATTTLSTTFVSNQQLAASVPASLIATSGTASITATNFGPGGGTSNVTFFSVTNPTPSLNFALASSPTALNLPLSMVVGDFNGDGKLDLAVGNAGDNTLSILLGDGTGNFTSLRRPQRAPTRAEAVGDFNGDGNLDIAVANFAGNTLSILLGDGTGNFALASSPPTGNNPNFVTVGDFNEDGNLDLAVPNFSSETLSILLGDGTGNFTLASSPSTGLQPYAVGVGDFNGDGNLDLAVANSPPIPFRSSWETAKVTLLWPRRRQRGVAHTPWWSPTLMGMEIWTLLSRT